MQFLVILISTLVSVVNAGEDIVFLATDINLAGAVDWVMMQTCFGHHFMLVLEKQERGGEGSQMFYTVVQLVGSRKQAENFAYRPVIVTPLVMWALEHCRISPYHFMAECRKRRLNRGSFVLLCFALFAFSGLCLVFVVCLF